MKTKYGIKKARGGTGCSLCEAKFEVWLNDSSLNEEKKEKISQHLLNYCPECEREA